MSSFNVFHGAVEPKVPTLGPGDFLYNTLNTTEDQTRYVPGGFHPTLIGDILGGSPQRQYRIMHKLGWGSYSTVWLAQRTDETNAFVSIKITTADDDAQTQEIRMLQRVARAQPSDQPQSHFLKLLDHFKLRGPNGSHAVIVTDVVVPILSLPFSKQPPAWRKAAVYGLAQAMTQLHASGIVHGDLHLGNVGIAMPQLADRDVKDVMLDLDLHDLTLVLPYDAAKQTASLPAYLISPCDLAACCQNVLGPDPPQMKVLDFGNAHEIGTHPHALQCAVQSCAPEIVSACVFEKIENPPLNPPTDVWALGTTVYEIVTGSMLFHRVGMKGLPSAMSKLAGRIPPHWEKWSASLSGQEFTQADSDELWARRWRSLRTGCENDADADALVRLLRAVFVLDPTERPTSAQIMNDPWFHTVSAVNATAPAVFIQPLIDIIHPN